MTLLPVFTTQNLLNFSWSTNNWILQILVFLFQVEKLKQIQKFELLKFTAFVVLVPFVLGVYFSKILDVLVLALYFVNLTFLETQKLISGSVEFLSFLQEILLIENSAGNTPKFSSCQLNPNRIIFFATLFSVFFVGLDWTADFQIFPICEINSLHFGYFLSLIYRLAAEIWPATINWKSQ